METNFLKNLFTRGDAAAASTAMVESSVPKRGFYKREEDRDFEMINQLDSKVDDCDRQIALYNAKLTPITAKVKELKIQYNKLKNKESAQAVEITRRATVLLNEEEQLKKRIANYEQKRITLSTQADNYRNVKEAEEMSKLLQESTIRMQGAIASLDIGTVKGTARDACLTSNHATNMTALVFNPFDIDAEETKTVFANKFHAFEVSEDEVEDIEDVVVEMPKPIPNRKNDVVVVTNKKSNLLLEDDLF